MVALSNRADHYLLSPYVIGQTIYIFMLWFVLLRFFSSPNLHSGFWWSKRWWGGSGIIWTICKSFAPCCRQTTTSTPVLLFFTGQMLFLMPNQQCWSTEGKVLFLNKWRMKAVEAIHLENDDGSSDGGGPDSTRVTLVKKTGWRRTRSCLAVLMLGVFAAVSKHVGWCHVDAVSRSGGRPVVICPPGHPSHRQEHCQVVRPAFTSLQCLYVADRLLLFERIWFASSWLVSAMRSSTTFSVGTRPSNTLSLSSGRP